MTPRPQFSSIMTDSVIISLALVKVNELSPLPHQKTEMDSEAELSRPLASPCTVAAPAPDSTNVNVCHCTRPPHQLQLYFLHWPPPCSDLGAPTYLQQTSETVGEGAAGLHSSEVANFALLLLQRGQGAIFSSLSFPPISSVF
jgi:hypothetical protein